MTTQRPAGRSSVRASARAARDIFNQVRADLNLPRRKPMSQDPVASEALAACPFCKARGEGVAVHRLVHAAGYWSVECDHCDCRGPSNDTAQGAADEWNKRAPAAPGALPVEMVVSWANDLFGVHSPFEVREQLHNRLVAWIRERAPAAPAVGDAQRIAKEFPYTPQDWLEVASRHMDDPITTMGADMAAMMNRLMTAEQRAEKAEAELSLLRQAGESKDDAETTLEHLEFLCSTYLDEPDERLTESAIRLKRQLQATLDKVISKSQARRVMESAEDEVERVAEALARYEHIAHGEDEGPDWTWESAHDQSRTEYLGMAQAAISAMRGEKG